MNPTAIAASSLRASTLTRPNTRIPKGSPAVVPSRKRTSRLLWARRMSAGVRTTAISRLNRIVT